MSKEDGDDKRYPPGFEHIEKFAQEKKELIQQLEEQIKNVPKDKGPRLDFRPPGSLSSRQFGSHDQRVMGLKLQIETIKDETLQIVETGLRDTDPTTARIVRDKVLEDIDPNLYQNLDVKERQKHQTASRDLEQSQKFADAQFSRNQSKSKIAPEEKTSVNPSEVPLTASQRFMQKFHYNKRDVAEKSPDKGDSLDKA